jgi:lactate racemase
MGDMQRIELNYGRGRLPVDLPDEIDLRVIRKRQMPVLPSPEEAVREALARPTATPPLAELARGKRSACILICDITRPVPNGLFLPILIGELLEAGLAAERIQVLVATGLHRPNEGAELEELVGSRWVMETVEVANHFARNDEDHVDLGVTPNFGVPVKLDRRLVEADLKIATGLVEPHFMAGYSGGRKVIAPGVAHKDTITTFHSARFMEHPSAANCVLDGNPLHEEQLEIVRMLGGAFALNTVIDEDRRLSYVSFGEIVHSHLAAVEHIRGFAEVPVARRFKTVVTSAAGYPLDKTYYQTVKGMVAPVDILAAGGDLIIASACSEGIGSPEFRDAQRRLVAGGPERFLESISDKRFADIDEWQTEMQLKPMRLGSIKLFSDGLSDDDRRLTGVQNVESIENAVQESVARSGDRRIAVIPEGPYVVPVYRPAAA